MLNMLTKIAKGVADTFGPDCETLVMDMDNMEHAIVSINNGHVTGRTVGGPPSELALEAIQLNEKSRDMVGFRSQLENGHTIKTSVFSIDDSENGKTYVIIINFDCTNLMLTQASISNLIQIQLEGPHNVFYKDDADLFNSLLNQALSIYGADPAGMNKAQRMEVVRYLRDKGGLLIQKSINKLAEQFGVSRCTIYNYLRELKSIDGE